MDETLLYGVDVQVMPPSDPDATMPYETVLPLGSSPDVEEMMPCCVEEQIQNADIDITIPYENTPPTASAKHWSGEDHAIWYGWGPWSK